MACQDCATGVLHEGTPTGREETIHGLQTYVADPPARTTSKGFVAIIPDLFGWKLNNNRILADQYAKRIGATVYLPDFMNGYVVDPSLLSTIDHVVDGKQSILTKLQCTNSYWLVSMPGFVLVRHMLPFFYFNRHSVTRPRIWNWFTALRESTSLPIGVAGFCWGGKFTVLLCNTDDAQNPQGKSLVDVAYTAHPSGLDLPKDIEGVKVPLCISVGTRDIALKVDGVEKIKSAFAKKQGSAEGKYELNVAEGAKHGFAIRGNPGDEDEKRRGQLAEDQAVQFFNKWLVNT